MPVKGRITNMRKICFESPPDASEQGAEGEIEKGLCRKRVTAGDLLVFVRRHAERLVRVMSLLIVPIFFDGFLSDIAT